jgi:UDP:flavonoid glycosyltransferase YjiC (YdhE family)
MLGSTGTLYRIARRKKAQLESLLHRIKPDLVVTDSEYALAPIRRRGIPIIAVNNADVVVEEYLSNGMPPGAVRSHFWGVEYPDYLFHRCRCRLVISPSAIPLAPRHPRIRRIGLIIRKALRDALPPDRSTDFPPPRTIRSAVFMLSGSILASNIPFDGGQLPFHVDVVGRTGNSRGTLTFHGKLTNNISLLLKADVLVINGGFSAVSEALALNKPTFVIPVPGHAEQFVNARIVSKMGRGYMASAESVIPMLMRCYELNRWEGLAARQPVAGSDGAREAADIIDDFARTNCREPCNARSVTPSEAGRS